MDYQTKRYNTYCKDTSKDFAPKTDVYSKYNCKRRDKHDAFLSQ